MTLAGRTVGVRSERDCLRSHVTSCVQRGDDVSRWTAKSPLGGCLFSIAVMPLENGTNVGGLALLQRPLRMSITVARVAANGLRQIVEVNLRTRRDGARPFDRVFQFTNISRPRVVEHAVEGVGGVAGDLTVQVLRGLREEIVNQDAQVFWPLA